MAIEKKLVAPCCWQGTLEVHHSELADSLHSEIRARLQRGEAPTSIEQSLVSRFGARLVAVPDPGLLEGTAGIVILSVLAAGGLVWGVGRSWAKRGAFATEGSPMPSSTMPTTDYDTELDAELKRFD